MNLFANRDRTQSFCVGLCKHRVDQPRHLCEDANPDEDSASAILQNLSIDRSVIRQERSGERR